MSDSPKKATTPTRGIGAGETSHGAPAGAADNLGSTTAGSKPAHESAAAPGLATPAVDHRLRPDDAFDALQAVAPGVQPLELHKLALGYALARGFIEPKVGNIIAAACNDMGAELGIPTEVRTWRRIRDELRTLRQALHIEGDQTATEAARGLEDVAAKVCASLRVQFPNDSTDHVQCAACHAWQDFTRGEGPDNYKRTIARVEHRGDCVLALAWRALGKPEPVGYP